MLKIPEAQNIWEGSVRDESGEKYLGQIRNDPKRHAIKTELDLFCIAEPFWRIWNRTVMKNL